MSPRHATGCGFSGHHPPPCVRPSTSQARDPAHAACIVAPALRCRIDRPLHVCTTASLAAPRSTTSVYAHRTSSAAATALPISPTRARTLGSHGRRRCMGTGRPCETFCRPVSPHPANVTPKNAQSAPGFIIGHSPSCPGTRRPITAFIIASHQNHVNAHVSHACGISSQLEAAAFGGRLYAAVVAAGSPSSTHTGRNPQHPLPSHKGWGVIMNV